MFILYEFANNSITEVPISTIEWSVTGELAGEPSISKWAHTIRSNSHCEVKRSAMIRNWYNQIPHPALKTKREITKYINWQQFTKGTEWPCLKSARDHVIKSHGVIYSIITQVNLCSHLILPAGHCYFSHVLDVDVFNMYHTDHVSPVMRKPVFAICEQQRRRSACASVQSDQRLCCSLPR